MQAFMADAQTPQKDAITFKEALPTQYTISE